jgi:hypothetical protein
MATADGQGVSVTPANVPMDLPGPTVVHEPIPSTQKAPSKLSLLRAMREAARNQG